MAGVIEIIGFSVVEPMNRTTPLSSAGSMMSLCDLLHRWHSSSNTVVVFPYSFRSVSACSRIWRISFTPVETALIFTNLLRVASAMMLASVVFPQPGGPKKMLEVRLSASMARRSSLPGPTTCFCPINSSKVRGRIRSANGALLLANWLNKSSMVLESPLKKGTKT